MAKILIRV